MGSETGHQTGRTNDTLNQNGGSQFYPMMRSQKSNGSESYGMLKRAQKISQHGADASSGAHYDSTATPYESLQKHHEFKLQE